MHALVPAWEGRGAFDLLVDLWEDASGCLKFPNLFLCVLLFFFLSFSIWGLII